MHQEVRKHRHSSWLHRKGFASAFPCLLCQDVPGRNSAGFTSETASQAQTTAHKAAWGSKMTTNNLCLSSCWLKSFLLNKGVQKCCGQHYQHFTQLIYSLSSVWNPSQSRSSKVPSEYTYPLLQQRKSFQSYFPETIMWKRRNWIKVWRGKCFNMCFYMKNLLGGTLWLFSQLAGPLPSHRQRRDRPNLCMCSCTTPGASKLRTSPALSLSKCLLTPPALQQPHATAFCQLTSSCK